MIPNVYSVNDAISLRVVSTDKFKTGMLSASAVLPIRREDVWLTSLLLSVLRRGTDKYPTLEALNRRLDFLYGTELSIRNFYRGDNQIIGFSAELLDNAYLPNGEDLLSGVIEIMDQILFHPLLDENGFLLSRYVESEKQMQCDAIRAMKNQPRAYAADRCREILYATEACGAPIYGTEEQVMAVTAEQLTSHWKNLLKQLHLDCFYVGRADAETLCAALRKTSCNVLSGIAAAPVALPRALPSVSRVKRVDESLDVTQGHLIMGFNVGAVIGEEAYYACVLLNEMLGISPVSKLFVNVRERLSLCYHCSSSYNPHKGTLLVVCGLSRANRARAEREILKQVRSLARGKFDDRELNAAKQSLVNAYRQLEDSPAAMEGFYFGRSLVRLEQTPEDCRRAFLAVTREDVIAVAKRIRQNTVYYLDGTLDGEERAFDEDD
jgi:predicted Zn-dependent peptidase